MVHAISRVKKSPFTLICVNVLKNFEIPIPILIMLDWVILLTDSTPNWAGTLAYTWALSRVERNRWFMLLTLTNWRLHGYGSLMALHRKVYLCNYLLVHVGDKVGVCSSIVGRYGVIWPEVATHIIYICIGSLRVTGIPNCMHSVATGQQRNLKLDCCPASIVIYKMLFSQIVFNNFPLSILTIQSLYEASIHCYCNFYSLAWKG